MFKEVKTAQVAAFFLAKAPGHRMPHLKLMKLLYLADRESMRETGYPMSWDRLVSMPHGPVLSTTLNLINGYVEPSPGGWEDWVADKEDHQVSLRREVTTDDLDELSPVEIDILGRVWQRFGEMGAWEIRNWTHDHCAEWEDANGSSRVIPYEKLAMAVGYDEKVAHEIAADIREQERLDQLFATR